MQTDRDSNRFEQRFGKPGSPKAKKKHQKALVAGSNEGNVMPNDETKLDLATEMTATEMTATEINHNRSVINLLLDDLKRRKEMEITQTQEVAAVTVGFMSKAFAIFFAYEFSQYFVHVIGGAIYGLPLSKWDTLWSYTIWMGVAYVFTPLVKMPLSRFNNSNHRSRTFLEDAACLFKDSLPVMVLWSYKDVVASSLALLDLPGDAAQLHMHDYDNDSIGEVFLYAAKLAAVVAGYTAFAFVLRVVMNLMLRTTGSSIAKEHVTSMPTALGIGLAFLKLFQLPYYFFPYNWVHTEWSVLYEVVLRLIINLYTQQVVIGILHWDFRRNKDAYHWLLNDAIAVWTKSSVFLFAWIWFQVFFDCQQGFPYNSCGSGTIWYWVFYSIVLTLVAIKVVPTLKGLSAMYAKLNHVYTDTLLKKDKGAFQRQSVSDTITISFFGIAVGWGWTMLADAECARNVTATCPHDLTAETISKYTAMVALYCGAAVFMFHSFMEYYRIFGRGDLVLCMEDGSASRVFGQMDTDNDGKITKDELKGYLASNDVDDEIFIQSFDLLDGLDGSTDDTVDSQALMHEFERLVTAIKDGDSVENAVHGKVYYKGAPSGPGYQSVPSGESQGIPLNSPQQSYGSNQSHGQFIQMKESDASTNI